MNHQKYKELLQLSVYDELADREKTDLENHLMECTECTEELKSIRQIYNALSIHKPRPVDDRQLTQARREFFEKLRRESEKVSFVTSVIRWFEDLFSSNLRLAFGGAASLMVGLLLGYILFAKAADTGLSAENFEGVNIDDISRNKVQISNIRFNNPESSDGELEFIFSATKPVTYKASLDDDFAKQLLATALLTAESPGVRLKSVNTLAMQSTENFIPDNKVKTALIASLKTDENPGVRRAAINTLIKFPLDTEIRDAMLFVLDNDDNAGIRIAAINSLSKIKSAGSSIDDEIRNVLRNKADDDENDFIRVRAASLLEEVK